VNIAEVLQEQAAQRSGSPALIETVRGRDRELGFRALESAAARIAGLLDRKGIRAGDRVLILHPMSIELYAFLIALFRIGAVAMFLDPSAGREYVERCLRIAPPKAFLGSAKAQLLRLWIPELRRVEQSFCSTQVPGANRISVDVDGPEMATIAPAGEGTPALITFTSGSTGEPKAVLRTHGFLRAQHRAMQVALQLRAGTFDLTTLPIFVLANLASGVTSVLPDADMRRPGFISPRPVLGQLQRLPIRTLAVSPAFVARLTEGCREQGLRIERIERVFMGGAPVFPDDLRQAREAFPNAEITAVYGSTEAEPVAEVALSSISRCDFDAMEAGCGLLAGGPLNSIDLRIVRSRPGEPIPGLDPSQFRARWVESGAVGEIVVSGEHVLTGYLNGEGDSETKFCVSGKMWHRTGDLGRLDTSGRLWLMGRASAAIEDERGVIYPFAVECAARQISGVSRAALAGVDGRRILVVEADSTQTVDRVRSQLAWAKLDEIRLVRSIPMDKRHNAKVDYVELRRLISEPR
jgi:acyl-CoA synthetase (AMP-forming)/AMP-acid ligase II